MMMLAGFMSVMTVCPLMRCPHRDQASVRRHRCGECSGHQSQY